MPNNNSKKVLMADDDAEDCMLAAEAFAETGTHAVFACVEDGIDLMEQLVSASKALPDLILLDLNMPRKDGREALIEIKTDPSLRHIPIVILTTSGEERDVALTAKAGAETFITKPATFDEWIHIMKSLADKWL